MKIGIIVHSFTGNTLLVAQNLMDALNLAGHTADIERVAVKDENPNVSVNIELENAPAAAAYDLLFFGAPVRGFSLSPGMKKYLGQLTGIEGKPAACFITKQLPHMWTGGNRALKQMTGLIAAKGGHTLGTAAVVWGAKDRQAEIDRAVAALLAVAAEGEA